MTDQVHTNSSQKLDFCRITTQVLNIQEATNKVSSPKAGAISSFIGTTRDNFDGKGVLYLEYEAYIPMAEKCMKEICQKIREKWDVINIWIEHRIGRVGIEEASVMIVISSAHRRESLEATSYAIDEVKAYVPVWKKEFYQDGSVWKENQEFRNTRRACCDKSSSSSSTSSINSIQSSQENNHKHKHSHDHDHDHSHKHHHH